MKELAYLNRYFYKYKWRFILGIIFLIISNYFRVLQPQMIRYALDYVVENLHMYEWYDGTKLFKGYYREMANALVYFGILTLIFALLMGVFMYFMRQTLIVMSRLIENDLKEEIYDHYQKLHQAFYKKNNTGDLMSRLTEDVSKVRMYLGPAVMYGINLIFLMVMVIYAMVTVNPMLTLYSLIPLPILSFSIYFVTDLINKKSTAIQEQLAEMNVVAQESYSGIRVLKAYGQEETMLDYFKKAADEYKNRTMNMVKTDAYFKPLMLSLIGASTIITVYVGGIMLMRGEVSAGNIAEFIIYINMLTWPVTSIGWVASIIQQSAASQKRINEFLKIDPEIQDSQAAQPRIIKGEILIENMSFTYPESGIKALKSVNCKINQGEKVAIVGKTGSGKTTLVDLILRVYDPESGKIYLDGVDLQKFKLNDIRSQIGYVPQDVFLFSDSVKNNIAFGVDPHKVQEVEKYAGFASIHNEILDLPDGYETQIGERGVTLSGGQKQRISIARALIKDPQIIIFDDCLSAVDTHTELEITKYLDLYCKGKTAIVITHRIYNALTFDKIIVMEEGEIVAIGTHESLIEKKSGYYYEIYSKQLSKTI
jgi:ATP-binding cassette subfamily B multidrug efflux pump